MRNSVIIFILIVSFIAVAFYQEKPGKKQMERGKELSKSCTNCHGTTKGITADPLQRIRQVRSADWIYRMTSYPMKFAAENKEAKAVFSKRGYMMPAFPTFTKDDINAVLDYLDSLPFEPKNYKHRNK